MISCRCATSRFFSYSLKNEFLRFFFFFFQKTAFSVFIFIMYRCTLPMRCIKWRYFFNWPKIVFLAIFFKSEKSCKHYFYYTGCPKNHKIRYKGAWCYVDVQRWSYFQILLKPYFWKFFKYSKFLIFLTRLYSRYNTRNRLILSRICALLFMIYAKIVCENGLSLR